MLLLLLPLSPNKGGISWWERAVAPTLYCFDVLFFCDCLLQKEKVKHMMPNLPMLTVCPHV